MNKINSFSVMAVSTMVICVLVLLLAFIYTQHKEINKLKAKPLPEEVYTGDRLCPKDKLMDNQYIVTLPKKKEK